MLGKIWSSLVERSEPIVTKIYNVLIVLSCGVICGFLYYNGLDKYFGFLEFFGLLHAHRTSLAIRCAFSFCFYYFVIALISIGADNPEASNAPIHIHLWALKFPAIVVLLFLSLLIPEFTVLTLIQPAIEFISFVGMLVFVYEFTTICTDGGKLCHMSDEADRMNNIGVESSNANLMKYSFSKFFAVISLCFASFAIMMLIHFFTVDGLLHECTFSISLMILTLVTSLFCCFIIMVKMWKSKNSSNPLVNPKIVLCQFNFLIFIIVFIWWKTAIIDDHSQCTAQIFIGETNHVISVIMSILVIIVCSISSTVDANSFSIDKISNRLVSNGNYSYSYYNAIHGIFCAYLCEIICQWTHVTLEDNEFSEELDFSIGYKAVMFDIAALIFGMFLLAKYSFTEIKGINSMNNASLPTTTKTTTNIEVKEEEEEEFKIVHTYDEQ